MSERSQPLAEETVAALRAATQYTKRRRRPSALVLRRKLTVRGSYRLAWKRNVGHASQRLTGFMVAGDMRVVSLWSVDAGGSRSNELESHAQAWNRVVGLRPQPMRQALAPGCGVPGYVASGPVARDQARRRLQRCSRWA